MRKRITITNYGKYYETVFVTSSASFDMCSHLSNTLLSDYGIKTCTINGDMFDEFDKDIKRILKNSYCVVFVLTEDVIELVNKTFSTDDTSLESKHSYIKTYAYVNKFNPRALACVIKEGCCVKDDLMIPEYMGDFAVLHRLELKLSTNFANYDAKTIYDNVRFFYNRKTKIILNRLHNNGINLTRFYYSSLRGENLTKNLIPALAIFLITLFVVPGNNYNPDDLWGLWLLVASANVLLGLLEMRSKDDGYALHYENEKTIKRLELIFYIIKDLIFILLGLFTAIGEFPVFLAYVLLLTFEFWQICKFTLLELELRIFSKYLDEETNYLNFATKRTKFMSVATVIRRCLPIVLIIVGIIWAYSY